MKKEFRYLMTKKNSTLLIAWLVFALFSGCKRNDDDVNTSFIEEKLSGGFEQEWIAPIYLSSSGCSNGTVTTYLTLYADHNFDYSGDCVYSGSWHAVYSTNRSGQFVVLNLTYFNGTDYLTDSFDLKYSAEQDIFYSVNHNDQSLYPFEKVVFAP